MAELLSIQEVAQITGLHEITIRRYVRSGELEAVRIGRRIRVRQEALDKLMKPLHPGVKPEPALPSEPHLKESAAAYEVTSPRQAVETIPEVVARFEALVEEIRQQATAEGTTTEEGTAPQVLAEKAIRRFLRYEARRRIKREEDAFRAMHAELRVTYPDQYVAVYRGQVIDHDPDQLALFCRLEERYPDAPVLIRQVAPEPEEVYTFHSPRVAEL